MHIIEKNGVNAGSVGILLGAMLAANIWCCSAGQEAAGWGAAQVTKTDLLAGETNFGKFAYFSASVMTRAGCHVAKVEGERGKGVLVRRDGQRGKAYADIAHLVFSPDGSALGYAVRGADGARFVVNDREGPLYEEVFPDTFAFGNDGKRHTYMAKKDGKLVAVVDGVAQTQVGGDMVPWVQPPVFSADGSGVGHLEGSSLKKKMRVVVNGEPGEICDGVGLDSLQFSRDGKRFSYSANDRSAGSRWFYVIDGQQRSAFDGVGVSSAFSADGKRFAYTGRRAGQWFLVEDGKPEVPIDGIVDYCLSFSPDSRRLAYAVAKPDRRPYLLLDDKAGPVHDGLGCSWPPGIAPDRASVQTGSGMAHRDFLLFSPDSRHLAYLARTGHKKKVFVDDKADEVEIEYLEGGMFFSEDSKRLAYGGRAFDDTFRDKCFLVVDGKRGVGYDALGHFGFSPDGKYVACAAKKGEKMVIVLDGQECGEYDSIPAGPVFRSDGALVFLAADKASLYRMEVRGL